MGDFNFAQIPEHKTGKFTTKNLVKIWTNFETKNNLKEIAPTNLTYTFILRGDTKK